MAVTGDVPDPRADRICASDTHPVAANGRLDIRHGNALMCYSIADR